MNNLFPGSKYLVTIREPVRAYFSRLKRMKDKARVRNIAHSHLYLLVNDANNIFELLKNNLSMRIVKIDDFAEHSEFLLRKLCEYLNINYDSSLEISSFCSKLYWGANPNYKSNKFITDRHVKPLSVKRYELLLFSIINKELNQITEYHTVQLSWIEKRLIVLWLLLPFTEDINWIKRAIYYNEYKGLPDYTGDVPSRILIILKLIKERFNLIRIYFRNKRSKKNYKKIKEYLIKPN
jgi:hypothetical protein